MRKLACVILVVAACGGSDSLSISQLFDDQLSTICSRVFDCQSQYDPTMHGSASFADYAGGSTEAECEATLKVGQGSAEQEAQTEVDAKRVKYDGAAAKQCIDGFNAETCDQVLDQNGQTEETPAACETVFVGLVPTGGSCVDDEDCANDDGCDGTPATCGGAGSAL